MTNEEELKNALDLLQEYDYVSWYQEAFGVVFDYIIELEKEIEDMRDATPEERKSTKNYIDSISKPTGFKFDDAFEELDFVQPHKKLSVNLNSCEDAISRTELLRRIDAERNHLLDVKMDGAEHIVVHHARRIIEDMPSVTPKSGWIPVSERLPEEFQCVLVTTGSRVDVCTYLKGSAYWKSYVLAWMPLPQPAKLED